MRVLMTGPIEKSGGVSTHTQMLARELKKKGIEVELYNTSPIKEKKYKPLDDLVRLLKKSFGVSFRILKDSGKVDLVHVQASGPIGGFIPAIFASLLKMMCKYKLAVTFHYSRTEKFVKGHRSLMKFVLARLDLFISVSRRQKTIISKYLGKEYENKIAVVPNGYDPKKFRMADKRLARELLNLPKDCRIIVNVANLVGKKGHKYLIEAMKVIVKKSKNGNVRCFIIGDGPLYDPLSEMIRDLNLASYVMLTGWVTAQNLFLYLNAADLFVLSSLSESFGIVQIEAMACGKPVVATRNGGSEEIITCEDYGLLCQPGNPRELARNILIALHRDWDRHKISRYAKEFTWDNVAEKTVEMYSGLL